MLISTMGNTVHPPINQLCPSGLAHLAYLFYHVLLDLNVSLVAHSLKKNPYPIGIFHFSFEYSCEIFQRAVFYHYPIAGPNLLINSDEAIFLYIGSNQHDGFFRDWGRVFTETDHTVNASGETNFMVNIVNLKLSENVTGK